jgi:hypothetical protein
VIDQKSEMTEDQQVTDDHEMIKGSEMIQKLLTRQPV